jgi:hypothetical protein
MDVQRVRSEVAQAAKQVLYVEAHPTAGGGIYVQAAFQTSAGKTYIAEVEFDGYPNRMPQVSVVKPALLASPHRYPNNRICYLHPNMWNPGKHNLTFVLARTAKWLNKYDAYQAGYGWPGAEQLH